MTIYEISIYSKPSIKNIPEKEKSIFQISNIVKMKKIILFAIGLCLVQLSNAQNILPTSGNVGIGTTNPLHGKLHIAGDGAANGINLWTNSGETTSRIWINSTANTFHVTRGDNPLRGITIDNLGLVGIGTATPKHGKLHISGNGASQGINLWTNSGEVTSRIWIDAPNNTFHLSRSSDALKGITIDDLGNVGMGTTTPTHRLAVNGTVRAKEIICEVGPWPDYVFASAYELISLIEVKNFIDLNGHLPNIPSAKVVAQEGIKLAEMNVKLLEKIEELTLYTIEQESKINSLENLIMSIAKDQELLKSSINQNKK